MKLFKSALLRAASIVCLGTVLLVAAACDDDGSSPPAAKSGTLVISLSENVAGDPLLDSATNPNQRYTNVAGNSYNIEIFEYLLTEFSLTAASAKMSVALGGAHYRNAFNATTNTLTLENVPVGNYEQLSFYWGVPDAMNFRDPDGPDGLPGEFGQSMAWPDNLGGGYHCDRLNGAHFDSQGNEIGKIALHMGRLDKGDGEVTNCHTQISLGSLDFEVIDGKETHLTLSFDLDRITNNPVIDFTMPAGMMGWEMTMPNHMAQARMRDNMGDVFSVVVEP